MKQIVLNIKYEYEDGRLSAISLLSTVIEKLPFPLLEENAQFFFLPLVLQLVNDVSEKCREAVANTISFIFQRVSVEILQTLNNYMFRWFNTNIDGESGIQRASAQLLGILVESRQDFIKRGNNGKNLISNLQEVVDIELEKIDQEFLGNSWELVYFCLICFEKVDRILPNDLYTPMWKSVVKSLAHSHLWIKQVASRVINSHLSKFDPNGLDANNETFQCFVCVIPGSLHEISKNLCRQIDVQDDQLTENLCAHAIKTLTWLVQAMYSSPELCNEGNEFNDDVNKNKSLEDISLSPEEKSKRPLLWLMSRLSHMAKNKGEIRREVIFKCFAAFASSCAKEIIIPYLDLMLIPLHRAMLETENMINQKTKYHDPDTSSLDFMKEVMQVIENKCGTEDFIVIFNSVKAQAKEKRDQRKQQIAAEAIHDPEAAAKRKIKKQEREKERKKRRIQERKMGIRKQKKRRY